ncbi:hypothetical protein CDD81_3514 [Ophiocordyceps australis]|uniref:Uncharacterized protein n=1 Tax=Ophiocordyceps australis TaxID=1399860 RepID=A0A2C5XS24_9HYPO|nr:hypothetical protein CDD81_3514 [Ophiocordyceps australis]
MSFPTKADNQAWQTMAYVSFGLAMNISVLLVVLTLMAARRRHRRQLGAVVHRGGIVFPNVAIGRGFHA